MPEERIIVRFPALASAFGYAWSRLPPRSRLRRAVISRIVRLGYEAANRRDFDVVLAFFDRDFELHFDESPIGGFVPPDLMGVHRGHEAFLRVWDEAVASIDLKIEHHEVIDFGDRLLACGRQRGRGAASGIPVDEPVYQLFTLRRGMVIREEDFVDRDKALRAAGRPV
ncbi:MAG TPA: nuclear transport factor 2 family protein [Solirubrobacterales bacterium]|nr:nuclear transport factor 2 family protein [Solirubrobacterales bacterium]